MPGERARAAIPTVHVAGADEYFGEVLPARIDGKARTGTAGTTNRSNHVNGETERLRVAASPV
jgi:hypothetical protein